MTISLEEKRPQAVLVSVQLQGVSEADHRSQLAELARLVDTLGFDVVGTVTQKRSRLGGAVGVGLGKLKELAEWTGGTGIIPSGATKKVQKKELHKASGASVDAADDEPEEEEADEEAAPAEAGAVKKGSASVVVCDNELTPSMVRNLERACNVEVLDRSGVIIEIFSRHARTKEAQMQVEIARLQYEAPRLREKETIADRQRGGGVGGTGESALELDKQRIRDRISELKEKLEELEKDAATRRHNRRGQMRTALVGYTNAGKSSLMRALSGSDVLIADKLFATLGTTVRAIPDTKPKILVSDTVGFIQNLPHGLVASFRSTLDEAHEASLLLFVVDASDPAFPAQLQVTKTVLQEIDADDIPSLLILNKIDRVDDLGRAGLTAQYPHAIQMSALDKDDVAALKRRLEEHFADTLQDVVVVVPHAHVGLVLGFVHEHLKVTKEDWDEEGARLSGKAPADVIAKLAQTLADKGGRVDILDGSEAEGAATP